MADKQDKPDMSDTFKRMNEIIGEDWEVKMIMSSHGIMGQPGAAMLRQMGIHEGRTEAVHIFDNACGSGLLACEVNRILPRQILERGSMFCADTSQLFVDLVTKRAKREGWVNTGGQVLDATVGTAAEDMRETEIMTASSRKLACPSRRLHTLGSTLPCILSQMEMPFSGVSSHSVPRAPCSRPEMLRRNTDCIRIAKPGGYIGLTTMHGDNPGWVPDIRSAFRSFPFDAPFPDKAPMQTHDNGRWFDPAWVKDYLNSHGLTDVRVVVQPGTYEIRSAAHFVGDFASLLPWLLGRYWSEDVRAAHGIEEVKDLITKHLEEKYQGKGWTLDWLYIIATGRVEK
jgi:hypothetical protein